MATGKLLRHKKQATHPQGGQPTWEVAYFFPSQGHWTEEDYLGLEDHCGGHIRVELYRGRLEVLPVPTLSHQLIVRFLLRALETYVAQHAPGLVLFSGIRVRLASGLDSQYREPDIVYMREANLHRCFEEYWEGADLVMEVVSGDPKDRERDLLIKPAEYAAARIPEYWIVDPEEKKIRVLSLRRRSYKVHGDFGPGMQATSVLLPRFSVAVTEVLAASSKRSKR